MRGEWFVEIWTFLKRIWVASYLEGKKYYLVALTSRGELLPCHEKLNCLFLWVKTVHIGHFFLGLLVPLVQVQNDAGSPWARIEKKAGDAPESLPPVIIFLTDRCIFNGSLIGSPSQVVTCSPKIRLVLENMGAGLGMPVTTSWALGIMWNYSLSPDDSSSGENLSFTGSILKSLGFPNLEMATLHLTALTETYFWVFWMTTPGCFFKT